MCAIHACLFKRRPPTRDPRKCVGKGAFATALNQTERALTGSGQRRACAQSLLVYYDSAGENAGATFEAAGVHERPACLGRNLTSRPETEWTRPFSTLVYDYGLGQRSRSDLSGSVVVEDFDSIEQRQRFGLSVARTGGCIVGVACCGPSCGEDRVPASTECIGRLLGREPVVWVGSTLR